jgi:DNA modification methylase
MMPDMDINNWPPAGVKWYYSDKWVAIAHGDCREILPQLDVKVDLVLTDPPYGLNQQWDATGKRGNSRLWDTKPSWDKNTVDIQFLFRLNCSLIIWGGNYYSLPPTSCWLIWDKVQDFSGADFEMAWTNLPLAGRIFRLSRIDAYQNKIECRKQHPTEKPSSLITWCISLANNIDLILDPFLGSGTTCYCAKKLNRYSIGIEIEEKYCEIAAKRCSQEVMELGL